MSDNCPDNIELHRPFIDEVTIKCPKCQAQMKRVPEVIDCWFDSGAMPFAQWHYPFENKELFEDQFPANFISEAVDQTRGWFYSLLAISTLIFNRAPYKNVIVLGHVQDENGQKMSKSKGNAVDPMEALEEYGADAIRWYFYSNSAPWLPNRFHRDAVIEGQRKFMGTLWNTYAFFVLYANIDGFDATKYTLDYDSLCVIDKWMLSRLNTLVAEVDANLENYKITETTKLLMSFVDDMSNWYVRRNRERFWAKEMTTDKINAYMTLYTTLVTLAKISAPMIPFMAEDIYRNLVCSIDPDAPISVHLCDFPASDKNCIDRELEQHMDEVLQTVALGRACRNGAAIKNRQPVAKMYVKADFELSSFYTDIIADELNIKEVVFTDSVRDFTSYSFKPQLKTLGPKYGKYLGEIRAALSSIEDGNAVMDELDANGVVKLALSDITAELERDDLLIEMTQKSGYASFADYGVTVVIDTNLTPELIEEGFVREVISKIQNTRKDSGFEVMDHIKIGVSGNEKIYSILEKNKKEVCDILLCDELSSELGENAKEWNINGEKVTFSVNKI
jgi:isoleucyl-tRNA synthetase